MTRDSHSNLYAIAATPSNLVIAGRFPSSITPTPIHHSSCSGFGRIFEQEPVSSYKIEVAAPWRRVWLVCDSAGCGTFLVQFPNPEATAMHAETGLDPCLQTLYFLGCILVPSRFEFQYLRAVSILAQRCDYAFRPSFLYYAQCRICSQVFAFALALTTFLCEAEIMRSSYHSHIHSQS